METIPDPEPIVEIEPELSAPQEQTGKKSKRSKASPNKSQKKSSKKKSKEEMNIENAEQPNPENSESLNGANKENIPLQSQDKANASAVPTLDQKDVILNIIWFILLDHFLERAKAPRI